MPMSQTLFQGRRLCMLPLFAVFVLLLSSSATFADGSSPMMLVFGKAGSSSPRFITNTSGSWSGASSMPSIGAEPYWVTLRNCPTRDEFACAILDKDKEIHALIYNGSSWSQTKLANSTDDNTTRAMDVAYESDSGDALFAYFDVDQKKIRYYTWNGSSLTNGGTFSLPSGDLCPWVSLYSDRNSDRIMLVALHKEKRLSAREWNGSSWGSWTALETDLETNTRQCYDFAYESQSGEGLIAYSESGNKSKAECRTWNGSSWSSSFDGPAVGSGNSSSIYWIRLEPDPNSDAILSATLDKKNDINVMTWNGSAWGSASEVESSVQGNDRRFFDVGYVNGGASAILVYNQSGQSKPRYRIWNGSSWGSELQGDDVGGEKPQILRIVSGLNENQAEFAWVDDDPDVEVIPWNGSTFTSKVLAESNGVFDEPTESFAIAAPVGPSVSLTPSAIPYATDFESGVGPEWSSATTDHDADFTNFLGRFNQDSVQLALDTVVGEVYQIEFDFFAFDSWDPDSNGDSLVITASGSEIFRETIGKETTSTTYENPIDESGALIYSNRSGADDDAIYRNVTVTFTATSSTTTITFSDTLDQDVDDESWGIDNVSVDSARFVDVSTAWNFSHDTSTASTYASGMHWFDADGDGDVDAILGGNKAKQMLNGGSSFASSTFGSGNERRQHAIFDVDNDGDVDFWSGNHNSYYNEACFENNGSGSFTDLGHLGFSDPNNNEGVAAADVNRDGWCDIVHFCENDNWIGFHQRDPGASLPSLIGTNDNSYGLSDSGDIGNGDYASAGDVNDDGYLDFFYHYSGGKLFVSNGDGTYAENVFGISVTTGNNDKFGSAWADYDNDGDLDLFCSRWDANNKGHLWRNDVAWGGKVPGSFTIQTDNAAINDESGQFGCAWGDYDNDGDLDLYIATRSGPNKLYQNQGNGTFRMMDVGAGVTGNCQDVVFVDFDNDGDLDIAVTREDDDAVLLENRTNNDNYLKIRVVGAGSGATNTAAIGVRVELWSGDGKTYLGRREIGVARSLGTEPLWAHFGGVDPAATYQVWTYLHSRDNSNPLVTTVVPQSVSSTIGSTTIPQMLTITEANAKKRIILWRELRNRSS